MQPHNEHNEMIYKAKLITTYTKDIEVEAEDTFEAFKKSFEMFKGMKLEDEVEPRYNVDIDITKYEK